MIEIVVGFLRETFTPHTGVFLAGALPVTELRAAIPLGVSLGLQPWEVFFYAVMGNIMPIPVLLALLPRLLERLSRTSWLGRRLDWCVKRTLRRSERVEKLGAIGLTLFTAIPLPGTGAWSASLAAVLFRIPPHLALPSIVAGVVIAGVVMTILSMGLFL